MTVDLIPNAFWRFPNFRFPSLWDGREDWLTEEPASGLSISEDERNIYVEAAVPGVEAKEVEVTFHQGVLWIKGEAKEEEKGKKYYRKASQNFSYRLPVPGEIDPNKEPEASYKNGVMVVTFAKKPSAKPRRIEVKKAG